MKKLCVKIYSALAIALLLLVSAQAGEFAGSAKVVFKGTSTLHDFEGRVKTAPFQATFSEDKKTGELRISASTTVVILELDTENKKRDKKMFKMFETKKYALIAGSVEKVRVPKSGSSEVPLRLKIHGVEKEIAVTLSDFQRDGKTAQCKMSFTVLLKEFGLKPPSVMGLIRVGNSVQIECIIKGTLK